MSHQASVPIVVVSARQDDSEAINQSLRNVGCAAHCAWLADTGGLATTLAEQLPELLFYFRAGSASEDIRRVADVRDRTVSETPLIVVAADTDEESIAEALTLGAQDLVSLANRVRLQAVAQRELHHCRQTRALKSMQTSTRHLEEQIESLVKESADAILLVQEGIIVNANPAWAELLGYDDPDDIVGTPALDVFVDDSHTAIKGAMVACQNGRWEGHRLQVKAIRSDKDNVNVEAEFELARFDDEPCLRISLALDRQRTDETPKEIVANSERHPLTGFFRRQRFLEEMEKKLAEPSRGGLWVLAYVKPDSIADLREQIGPLSSDDVLLEFARILQEHSKHNDVFGQFGGDLFMVLMPRGTARDALAWAENLRSSVAAHLFDAAEKSRSVTCTIGLARHADDEDLSSLIMKAQKAYLRGVEQGGNQTLLPDLSAEEEGHRQGDTAYVQKIKGALRQDDFRLVFQPVANLSGQSQQMFDVLLRMMDQSRELMPGTFLPAARRNGLMKNIDRWVIANAMRFCKDQNPAGLFIRLSAESMPDDTLVSWIDAQIKSHKIDASSLIFQITESDTEERLREVKTLATSLKAMNCRIALEHFGVAPQPLQILEHVPLDFLKIDGSLMEGIAADKNRQKQVRAFIEAATEKHIHTVAERVEDANTMAVLWQLGIEYIQGFYVQGPEEIVLESA